jgi:hypothetical protein
MQKSLTNKETNSAMITNKNTVEADREIEVPNVISTEDKNTEIHKVTKNINQVTEQKNTSHEAMPTSHVLLNESNAASTPAATLVVKRVVTLLCKCLSQPTVHHNTLPYATLFKSIKSHHMLKIDREGKIRKCRRGRWVRRRGSIRAAWGLVVIGIVRRIRARRSCDWVNLIVNVLFYLFFTYLAVFMRLSY